MGDKADITSTLSLRYGLRLRSCAEWASEKDGSFKRQVSGFRDLVSPASEKGKYPAEKGRYVLYVSYACPWSVDGDQSAR